MELSILIAKLAAVFFVSVGIRAVTGKLNVTKMLKSFDDSSGLTIMSGFAMIAVGGLLIEHHNIWSGWQVLVTLIGWAGLLKGISFIAFPQMISGIGGKFTKAPVQQLGFVIIALGLIYAYFGFVA